MRSRFIRLPNGRRIMADPEPPQPTPFPIRIVQDPPPRDLSEAGEEPPSGSSNSKSRSDYFYAAWDKFLAIEPDRAARTSTIARKTAAERDAAGAEGLAVQENAATSWEQAARECRAKVKAIVEECERLNQKYRDAIFDLEANEYCLKSLGGQYPKVRRCSLAPCFVRFGSSFESGTSRTKWIPGCRENRCSAVDQACR